MQYWKGEQAKWSPLHFALSIKKPEYALSLRLLPPPSSHFPRAFFPSLSSVLLPSLPPSPSLPHLKRLRDIAIEIVLSKEGLDINALTLGGHSALDIALNSKLYAVAIKLITRGEEKEGERREAGRGREVEEEEEGWFPKRDWTLTHSLLMASRYWTLLSIPNSMLW
jgi:hypothetical protein